MPLIKTLFQKIGDWYQTAYLCSRVQPLFSKSYIQTLRHAIRLCSEEGFSPRDVYKLGLMRPDLSPEMKEKCLSKKRMMEVQSRLNPKSWINVTEDKGIFYVYAKAWGLPIPRLYALYFQKSPGWAPPNIILSDREDWMRFLDREIPDEFVIKPCRGVYGKKVRIFIKSGRCYADPFGKKYGAEEIYKLMSTDQEYDRFAIQERFINHPELVRLTGTPFLQTVRISSFIDEGNKCHLLHASFRMITGDQVVDNFSGGGTGNMLSGIDMETGRLNPAMSVDERGVRSKDVVIHPRTGEKIEGFEIPLWEEARSLILETAPKFLPIRTLGWDVGITPRGPVIIEANMFWDPPNQSGRGRVLLNKIKNTGMKNIL